MKPNERTRLAIAAVMSLSLPVVGCIQSGSPKHRDGSLSVRDKLGQAGPSATAGNTEEAAEAPKPPPGTPVAIVNGRPIERRALLRTLVATRGLPMLQQMILRELAKAEAERLGKLVTQEQIDHEYDITLQAAHLDGKDIEALTPARREQLLEEWTRTRDVSREELAIAMERQAHLRAIAGDQIEITDERLQAEFQRAHGEKVEVRHIQLAAKRVYPQIVERLGRGEPFKDLVAEYSQNTLSRERQGVLPPFSAEDPSVPAIFAEVAFQLTPGDVSNPIEAEGSYHVLKLERRIPAENVAFDDAKDKLRANLAARLVAERMEETGRRLLLGAKIEIRDRVLSAQYDARRAAGTIQGPPRQ